MKKNKRYGSQYLVAAGISLLLLTAVFQLSARTLPGFGTWYAHHIYPWIVEGLSLIHIYSWIATSSQGNVKVKIQPDGVLSDTEISPPWARMMERHKQSPRPRLRRLSAMRFAPV